MPANTSTQAAAIRGVVLFQNCRTEISRLRDQRANATATPKESTMQAPRFSVSQSYTLRNVSRKTIARTAGRCETSRAIRLQISASHKKKVISTRGEIQKISLETCIIGPHRAQLSL